MEDMNHYSINQKIEQKTIIGILLAAGLSTRFGISNKCLYPLLNGIPIGVQSARNLAKVVANIICIVPENSPELNQVFIENGFNTLVNSSPHKGLSESIRLGIQYAQQNRAGGTKQIYEGCLIALADMPWINPKTMTTITNELVIKGGIVAPVNKGQRGHPVGFSKNHFPQLEELKGDQGARSIIKSAGETLHLIEVDDSGVLQDIDTTEDLLKR